MQGPLSRVRGRGGPSQSGVLESKGLASGRRRRWSVVWGQVLGHGSGSGVGVHASQSTMRTSSRVVGALCPQLCAMRALCWNSRWLSWSGHPSGCPWVSRHVRAQPSPDRSGLGAIRTVAADAGSRGRRLAWQQRCRGRVGPLRASAAAQVKVAAAPPSAVG